ncbi:hypothetical protein Daus18300_010801 [Diaporthe australafricana]|uniref:Protein kinase domain-containing protein n=1 Tax=Diaporthe australafricana TaxID=127596 RepID=A0ABR3W8Z5_9PEZI
MLTRLDSENDLLFMEFGKLGDLHKWMHKLSNGNDHLPVAALWQIFDCLVKACMAMDYAPRMVPGPSIPPGAAFAPLNGGYLPETVPPGGHAAPLPGFVGTVHFDLDPRNIFVRGYDEPTNPLVPSHTQIPRFQVADFGLAKNWADLWAPPDARNAYTLAMGRWSMWKRREMGKDCWFLPYPDFPPVAGRMTSEEPPGIPEANVPRNEQRWTYGHDLIGPSMMSQQLRTQFSQPLCETVARCLMARQEHRPDLQQLQATVAAALGAAPQAPLLPLEVPAFFGNDPPPPPPWRMRFQTVDARDLDPWGAYSDEEGAGSPPAAPRPRRRRPRGRRPTRLAPEDRAYRP